MSKHTAAPDFTALIKDRTQNFSGRDWVFAALNEWLADPHGHRVFVLAGAPGTGKTAIAARLVQAGHSTIALPGLAHLTPGFLTHAHFCVAGSDSTLSPTTFVQALSESLANAFPAFGTALGAQSASVTVSPVVHTGPVSAGATVAGLIAKKVHIEIHGDDARAMFDVAVRRPLLAIAPELPQDPVLILVDSLDEALTFSHDRSIAHLLQLVSDFPPSVRFLLTCRSKNDRAFRLVGPPTLDLVADAPPGLDDVEAYASTRLSSMPEPARTERAGEVATKSRGNFLYAYHVLNQLLSAGSARQGAQTLQLPAELNDVYRAFLERELAADPARWSTTYRPLLGAVAVARGNGLSRSQLSAATRLRADVIGDVVRSCREYLTGGDAEDEPLGVYHHSFREFLLNDAKYTVFPAERHADIARAFLTAHDKAWRHCDDAYALRYTPFHLAEAARAPSSERDAQIRSLIELTANARFQARCDTFLHDVPLVRDHLVSAAVAAASSDRDDMLPWLVRAARNVVAFRDRFLTGASVTAIAREGEIDTAQGRLELFAGLDRDWQTAAGLILAWLSSERQPERAKEAIERLALAAPTPPLSLLLARLRAAAVGRDNYPADEQPAQAPDVGLQLVRRLSGQPFDRELLLSRSGELITEMGQQAELIDSGGYAATLDGPVLVNSAREYDAEGTPYVDAYIAAHAGYNYVEYRNRSLWVLLQAVLLHHPDQRWVRDRLARILEAAMTSGGAEFVEMAPLVAHSLVQQQRGNGAPALDDFAASAWAAIEWLKPERGANDTWSLHRRRLTALMEAETLVRGDAGRSTAIWRRIEALEAQGLLEGFAGFRATAELRLAEALRLCHAEGGKVQERLGVALRTAHHIQDYHFCARITARCNALVRWDATAFSAGDLEATVDRLARTPGDVEFAADHAVGEPYSHREDTGFVSDGLPVWPASDADTLERLADVFQRPAVEFLRLNPGRDLRSALPAGTLVRVPDPGLVPLLALHLAARVVSSPALGAARASLVRSLVPLTVENPTALDSLLAYLLVVADPEDVAALEKAAQELGPAVIGSASFPSSHILPGAMPS